MAAKGVALEHMQIFDESAEALFASWKLDKIDMVREFDDSRTLVKPLNTHLVAARQQVSDQTPLQSELLDAQQASYWIENCMRGA